MGTTNILPAGLGESTLIQKYLTGGVRMFAQSGKLPLWAFKPGLPGSFADIRVQLPQVNTKNCFSEMIKLTLIMDDSE